MTRKLSDAQRDEIRSLAHLPQRDIARRVGVSAGVVSKVLKGPAPAAPRERPETPPPEPPPDADDGAPIEVRLDRAIRSLERAATAAAASGDVARQISAERAATAALALAARLRPVPKVDPNDQPDLIKLAKEGEGRLMKLARALHADSDAWPTCPTCSQKIQPKEPTT